MKLLTIITSAFLLITVANAQNWEYVGPCCIDAPVGPLTSSGSEDLDFTSDGIPVVSYFTQTGGNTTAKCKKFENGVWSLIGENIPVSGVLQRIDLEIFENNIYAASLSGSTNLSVWHFDGSDWSQMGTNISANLAFEFEHDNNGDLYLFLATSSIILKYNGTDWTEIWTQNTGSSLSWSGDRSIICDENNHFFFNETTMTPNFSFITQMMKFDGAVTSPIGDYVYSGGGINGRLGLDQEGNIYNQYTINNTNKIVKLINDNWEHQIDTTNVLNTIFGFNYIFDSSNDLILQNGMNLYFGNDYSVFPAIDVENSPIIINDMVVSPTGDLYASFGEIAPGSGSDFSVVRYNDNNSVNQINQGFVQVYPNPVMESLQISSKDIIKTVEFYDLQGKLISTFQNINQFTFNIIITDIKLSCIIAKIITNKGIYKERLITL